MLQIPQTDFGKEHGSQILARHLSLNIITEYLVNFRAGRLNPSQALLHLLT